MPPIYHDPQLFFFCSFDCTDIISVTSLLFLSYWFLSVLRWFLLFFCCPLLVFVSASVSSLNYLFITCLLWSRLNLGVQVDLPHALVPTFSDVGVQEDTPRVPVPKLLRGFQQASLLTFKVPALPPLASTLPASPLLASRPLCIHGMTSGSST
ncbi:hypothetical protein CHARACLAT_014263 [Characodon lateralis]|uniref:Uncharacterized protein n=1 Tax=Characodon lateralis TaxID=208331 RepID=A0ABU7E0G0_9TELE|nr:hypothetical protein [Characodon lateralis]